MFKTMIVPLR